jgi:hypothetical protein
LINPKEDPHHDDHALTHPMNSPGRGHVDDAPTRTGGGLQATPFDHMPTAIDHDFEGSRP